MSSSRDGRLLSLSSFAFDVVELERVRREGGSTPVKKELAR
jgi:hypothetical protein